MSASSSEPFDATPLIEESWRILKGLIFNGTYRLQGGRDIAPSDEELIRLASQVARMQPPRGRKMPIVEDFQAPVTHRTRE